MLNWGLRIALPVNFFHSNDAQVDIVEACSSGQQLYPFSNHFWTIPQSRFRDTLTQAATVFPFSSPCTYLCLLRPTHLQRPMRVDYDSYDSPTTINSASGSLTTDLNSSEWAVRSSLQLWFPRSITKCQAIPAHMFRKLWNLMILCSRANYF